MAGFTENPREGRIVEYGVALEGAYDVQANANGGANVVKLTTEDINIGMDMNVDDIRTSTGSNQRTYADSVRSTSGSAPPFTVSGPINTHIFGIFMGSYSNTGTWTATTFTGPFTPWETHPDFDGDQKSFTLYLKDNGVAGRDEILTGCKVTSMKITGEKRGVLMFEASGQGNTLLINQTLDGTMQTSGSKPDHYGRVRWEDCKYQLDVGAGNVSAGFQSFEVSMGYDEVTQEQVGDDGKYEGIGTAGVNGTFNATILKNAAAATARGRQQTGDPITLTISRALSIVCTGLMDDTPTEREGLAKVPIAATMLAADADTNQVTINW